MSPLRRGAGPTDRQVLARLPWGIVLLSACIFAALALPMGYYPSHGGYWALAGAVMTLCLAWRHRFPLQVWAIVTAAGTLLVAFWPTPRTSLITLVVLAAPLIALYSLAARTSRSRGRAALALSTIALGGGLYVANVVPYVGLTERSACAHAPSGVAVRCLVVVGGLPVGYEIVLIGLGALVTSWALGERTRASREAVAAIGGRAAALDAERAERERAAAAGERARIAGELHDITAHHVSVVALQAGAARMLAESGQPPDVELLRGIETASRQAMTEIRQALGVIRSSDDGPAPGAAQLPELAGRMVLAGLAVTIEDSAGALPSHIDLAVYRIVQECLSNVLRHSAAGTALVTFRRSGEQLEVAVADDGPARERGSATGLARPAGRRGLDGATEPDGHGLIGLRERVQRLGGQFRAGTRPDGGFEVRALLPVPGTGQAAGQDEQAPAADRAELPAGVRQ